MKIIFNNIKIEDLMLAVRTARWLIANPSKKDGVLTFGEPPNQSDFYACRNKASITVRPCCWTPSDRG